MMDAKTYLKKVKEDEDFLKRKSVELYQMKCLETSITAPLDPNKVQCSGPQDKVGNLVSQRIDLERQIETLLLEYANFKNECIGILEEVRKESHIIYKILHQHYIEYIDLNKIAPKEGYSYQRIKELHKEGLEKVQKILENSKVHTQSY
jgi:hypothetical protein